MENSPVAIVRTPTPRYRTRDGPVSFDRPSESPGRLPRAISASESGRRREGEVNWLRNELDSVPFVRCAVGPERCRRCRRANESSAAHKLCLKSAAANLQHHYTTTTNTITARLVRVRQIELCSFWSNALTSY